MNSDVICTLLSLGDYTVSMTKFNSNYNLKIAFGAHELSGWLMHYCASRRARVQKNLCKMLSENSNLPLILVSQGKDREGLELSFLGD